MNHKIITLFFGLFPMFGYSQKDSLVPRHPYLFYHEVTNTLLTGFNFQSNGDTCSTTIDVNRWFAEVGLHRTSMHFSRHGPAMFTYGLSTLASADKNNKIIGFRAGAWTSYLLSLGLSMTYYTNFKQGNFKITPEFGFGMAGLKLAVGYNIPTFANKDFRAMRDADVQLMIHYLFKIKTVKLEKKW